jgi:hypothetical protein
LTGGGAKTAGFKDAEGNIQKPTPMNKTDHRCPYFGRPSATKVTQRTDIGEVMFSLREQGFLLVVRETEIGKFKARGGATSYLHSNDEKRSSFT